MDIETGREVYKCSLAVLVSLFAGVSVDNALRLVNAKPTEARDPRTYNVDKLIEFCKTRKLNLKAVNQKAGFGSGFLYRVKSGERRLSGENVERIAEAFNLRVHKLKREWQQ